MAGRLLSEQRRAGRTKAGGERTVGLQDCRTAAVGSSRMLQPPPAKVTQQLPAALQTFLTTYCSSDTPCAAHNKRRWSILCNDLQQGQQIFCLEIIEILIIVDFLLMFPQVSLLCCLVVTHIAWIHNSIMYGLSVFLHIVMLV